jgi:hypothetical protein
MKKLFALLMVAGSIAMYSCGGEKKEESTVDTTAVETPAPVEEAAPAAPDTAAAAPAAADTATKK